MHHDSINSTTRLSKHGLLESLPGRLLETSLVAVVCLAPLALGGRHPFGEFVLILSTLPGVTGLILLTTLGKPIAVSRTQVTLLALFCCLPLMQQLPLPKSLVGFAHPGVGRLAKPELIKVAIEVPSTQADTNDSHSRPFSIAPANSAKSFPILLAFAAIFLIAKQHFATVGSVLGTLRLLTFAAAGIAILALLQANFGNGRFLWLYEHPARDPGTVPRGPFQNENHLASFLALAIPGSCYLLLFSKALADRLLAAFAMISIALTVFLTPSRGGIAVVTLALLTWSAMILWAFLRNRFAPKTRSERWINLGALLALACFTGVCVLATINLGAIAPWRAKLWLADFQLWKDFPIFGIGLRNHEFVYRAYLHEYSGSTFNFAESSWIQILVETGIVGLIFSVFALCVVFFPNYSRLIRSTSLKDLALIAVPLVAIITSTIHAMADFPWHIPACFSVLVIIAAASAHLSHRRPKSSNSSSLKPLSNFVALPLTLILFIGTAWSVSNTSSRAKAASHWDAYLRLSNRTSAGEDQEDSRDLDPKLLETQLLGVIASQPTHIRARQKLLRLQTQFFVENVFDLDNPDLVASKLLSQSCYLAEVAPTTADPYFCASQILVARNATLGKPEMLLDHAQVLEPGNGFFAMQKGVIALQKADVTLFRKQLELAINHYPPTHQLALERVLRFEKVRDILQNYQLGTPALARLYSMTASENKDDHHLVGKQLVKRLVSEASTAEGRILDQKKLENAQHVAVSMSDTELQIKVLTLKIANSIDLRQSLKLRAKLYAEAGSTEMALADLGTCLKLYPIDEEANRLAVQYRKSQFR